MFEEFVEMLKNEVLASKHPLPDGIDRYNDHDWNSEIDFQVKNIDIWAESFKKEAIIKWIKTGRISQSKEAFMNFLNITEDDLQ